MSDQRIYYSREAEMQAKRERAMAIAIFMSIGLVIGAMLALLFAPDEGKKSRRNILGSIEGGLDSSRETTARALQKLEADFQDFRRRVEDRLG